MHRSGRTYLLVLTALFLSGCLGTTQQAVQPEDEFGHRVEGVDDDGRQTITITPPDSTRSYRYLPAVVETVNVRPAPITESTAAEGVPVEVLIKGAFPDACSQLHEVMQDRSGNIIDITLRMRRQQGAVCASVLRPYRFYLSLTGRYTPGSYTIHLNDKTESFTIRAPAGN